MAWPGFFAPEGRDTVPMSGADRTTAELREASEKLLALSRQGYRVDIRFVDADVVVRAFDAQGRIRATTSMPRRNLPTAIMDAYIALDVSGGTRRRPLP